jgi:hypothetical protein
VAITRSNRTEGAAETAEQAVEPIRISAANGATNLI